MTVGELVATIEFTDPASGDETMAFVRCVEEMVSIGLTIKEDGDLDVAMTTDDCERFAQALQTAIARIRQRAQQPGKSG